MRTLASMTLLLATAKQQLSGERDASDDFENETSKQTNKQTDLMLIKELASELKNNNKVFTW